MSDEFSVTTQNQDEVTGTIYAKPLCPYCQYRRPKVTNTLAPEGGLRVRYHKCDKCGRKFKSIEEIPQDGT